MSEFIEFVKETLFPKVGSKIVSEKRLYITDLLDYEGNLDDFLIFFFHFANSCNIVFGDLQVKKCIEILELKKHDYSNYNRYSCFGRTYQLSKLWGATSRDCNDVFIFNICQKIARIENLLQNNIDPKNESLIDSFIDLINYRLLWEGYKLGLQ